MSKLVSVEYCPAWVAKGGQQYPWLDGCLGELYEEDLLRAIKSLDYPNFKGISRSKRAKLTEVRVRFPLAAPYHNTGYYPGKPLPGRPGKHSALTTVPIPLSDLLPSKQLPISLYERRPLLDTKLLRENFSKSHYYYYTRSLSALSGILAELANHYKYSWVWKLERTLMPVTDGSFIGPTLHPVFMEARMYGVGSLIKVHSSETFQGVALAVYTRPLLPVFADSLVIEDVLLFTNTEEYVDYIDGTSLGRLKANNKLLAHFWEPNIINVKKAAALLAKGQGKKREGVTPAEIKPMPMAQVILGSTLSTLPAGTYSYAPSAFSTFSTTGATIKWAPLSADNNTKKAR